MDLTYFGIGLLLSIIIAVGVGLWGNVEDEAIPVAAGLLLVLVGWPLFLLIGFFLFLLHLRQIGIRLMRRRR